MRIEATGYSLRPACVDRARAATSSRQSNASVRSRHRIQPKRAAFAGEITPSQVESMKSKSLSYDGEQPWLAQMSRILQRGQRALLTELCTTGNMSPLLTVGPATTTSTTLRLTQQYYTTTSSPWRAPCMSLCRHQVSNCRVCPVWGGGRGVFFGLPRHEQAHNVAVQCPSPPVETRTPRSSALRNPPTKSSCVGE